MAKGIKRPVLPPPQRTQQAHQPKKWSSKLKLKEGVGAVGTQAAAILRASGAKLKNLPLRDVASALINSAGLTITGFSLDALFNDGDAYEWLQSFLSSNPEATLEDAITAKAQQKMDAARVANQKREEETARRKEALEEAVNDPATVDKTLDGKKTIYAKLTDEDLNLYQVAKRDSEALTRLLGRVRMTPRDLIELRRYLRMDYDDLNLLISLEREDGLL